MFPTWNAPNSRIENSHAHLSFTNFELKFKNHVRIILFNSSTMIFRLSFFSRQLIRILGSPKVDDNLGKHKKRSTDLELSDNAFKTYCSNLNLKVRKIELRVTDPLLYYFLSWTSS